MTPAPLFWAILPLICQQSPPPAPAPPLILRASLTGPVSVQPGERIMLDPSGTFSSKPPKVKLARGPEQISVRCLYDLDDSLAFAMAVATKPGTYDFVIIASSGGDDPIFEFGFWQVIVGNLPPPPTPGPTPGPTPTPTPTPTPVPASTFLYAFMVYTDDPADPNLRIYTPVIKDPTLSDTLKALSVEWRPWPRDNPAIDSMGLRPYVGQSGPPVLIVYDAKGVIYNEKGVPVDRSRAALTPPRTSAELVNMFKAMRGK